MPLSLVEASVVESAPRSMMEHGNAVVALPMDPVMTPLPERVTVFPGPAVASPSTFPPDTLMLPFERMLPRPTVTDESIRPSDTVRSPQEVIAWETSGAVSAKGSEVCAPTPTAKTVRRHTKSRRMADDRI
ncbi:MAG TPA: hypothetical protein VGJ81_13750 [Thermoanaerobaculia bacterium]